MTVSISYYLAKRKPRVSLPNRIAKHISPRPDTGPMDKGEVIRRLVHCFAPVFLVYYLLPADLWGLMDRRIGLVLVMIGVLWFDYDRIRKGEHYVGLRHYERRRLGAYACASVGITISYLFFPMAFVVVTFCAMAWVDPLIGILREGWPSLYPTVPLVAYFTIISVGLLMLTSFPVALILLLAIVTTVVAIMVEYPKIWWLDDDFLLLTVPVLALWLAFFVLTGKITPP